MARPKQVIPIEAADVAVAADKKTPNLHDGLRKGQDTFGMGISNVSLSNFRLVSTDGPIVDGVVYCLTIKNGRHELKRQCRVEMPKYTHCTGYGVADAEAG